MEDANKRYKKWDTLEKAGADGPIRIFCTVFFFVLHFFFVQFVRTGCGLISFILEAPSGFRLLIEDPNAELLKRMEYFFNEYIHKYL